MMKKLPVARVGEIAPEKTKVFRFGVQNGIAYNDDGVIKAYVNACPHMGGPTELQPSGVLRCRWHEAEFDPQTGERVCGQAPEGTRLKPIELVIEGEQIFAMLELTDPFSF
jgi:nitrite reductase/ring-hydroxylating ferredoxin subunit